MAAICCIMRIVKNFKKEITRLKLRRRGSFGGSTFVSLFLRPFLEKDRVKAMLAAPLFAAAVTVGVNQLPSTQGVAEAWDSEQPIQTVLAYDMKLPQQGDRITYLLPVSQLSGVSQGFHTGHPGIDLRAPLGSPVIAMERGVVTKVENDTFGYGKHVYVKHTFEITSMYAHLGQILIHEGDQIQPAQQIGIIGLTGWSTGPHLHFEVYEGNSQVNPMKYIGGTLEWAKGQALAAKK